MYLDCHLASLLYCWLARINLACADTLLVDITVDQMYRIENSGHEMGFLKTFMMENAGAAATRRIVEHFDKHTSGIPNNQNPDMARNHTAALHDAPVLVIAGLGNNGGDGMVIARHLAGHGASVTVCLLGSFEKIKTDESRWNWSLLAKMPSVVQKQCIDESFIPPSGATPVIIIDAMFGTGITGQIKEPHLSAIDYVNSQDGAFKFAVDVPSGLDPQTGQVANAHVRCDMTVTFHKMKQGIPRRPDLTGTTYVEKIGIPPEAEDGIL